ncbi:MAG: S-methyl-5-thioribose-1-phosphate isomerase, partial [bacterium]
ICDDMAGRVMQEGKINKVLVGADRVAANGDVANKIGTYPLAVLAKENEISFYVACPFSSIDLSLSSGKEIPIEQRDSSEIISGFGKRIAPQGIKSYNPAFDVTPARYIKGIITEKGIHKPPYEKSLQNPFPQVLST